ncbi:MAG: hypothetical protein PHV11_00400 [Candidatus Bipolaricaulis sp.]|nr:hypothetical protein [Candidatus Bipolaricaulis sp.]
MVEKAESKVETGGDAKSIPNEINQKEEMVPVAEFRKLQAAKDREVAAALAESRALRESQEAMRKQLESLEATVADPEARRKLADQRMQAELDALRKESALRKLFHRIATDYEVPVSVLETAIDESSAVKAALDWLKSEAKQVKEAAKEQQRQEAISAKEKDGALNVVQGVVPLPTPTVAQDALASRTLDFKKKIDEAYKRGDKRAAKALYNEWYKGNVKGPLTPKKPVV